MTQSEAFEKLKHGSNIFLTGQPGAGKSYLTNRYIDWLIDNGHSFAVTASTGIAALNIKGKTLHSFSGLRNDEPLSDEDIEGILSNRYILKRYKETRVLIIDEISMVSAQMLDNLNSLAKTARGSEAPFGGIKVVAVGDFYQLPPINGKYCFDSNTWKEAGFEFCNITEQHRTSDNIFIDILTNIRAGHLTEEQKTLIGSRLIDDVSELDVVRLDTHNQKVDEINQAKLARLTTPPKTYRMKTDGMDMYVDSLKKGCLSPEVLILKVGAKVIFTRNDFEQRFVNGTQGEVVALEDNYIIVRLFNNSEEIKVGFATWEYVVGYGMNKQVLASISQIPVRLAWAITIHKSQGMTLDRAVIDVSRVFATGQAYVAISRVRSLDGVFLQGKITEGFLKVSSEVKRFYDSYM